MEEFTFYHITYTHMKKLILLLALLISSCCIFAQQPELTDKVASIEAKVAMLETVVNAMQQKVDEVTAQNLALKQAISLQPTIAEATSESGVNYRLIAATGKKQTGEFTLVISAMNPTKRDIKVHYTNGPTMVDEKGYSYIYYKDMKNATIANEALASGVLLMPDTPVEMKLIFVSDTEPQYIKSFDLQSFPSENEHRFRFTNIPIKWE